MYVIFKTRPRISEILGANFEQPNGFSDLDDQRKIIKHAHIQAVQDGLQSSP